MPDLVSKEQLLDNMRAQRARVVAVVAEVPEAHWSEGRYEDGWTARDILAHIASIEWTYPRILDLADKAKEPEPPKEPSKPRPPRLGDYNQRQVAKRADVTVQDLLEEFERNRAATIAAVEEADEDLLRERVRTAGGVEGTAAEALNFLAVIHLDQHLDDLRGTS
jgi:uncharacterized damage-inducible protein DinB